MKRTLLASCLILLSGCIEKTPVERIPETFARRAPAADERKDLEAVHGFIGVRVQDNQSDSLEDLAFLPGVRVIEVVESSPAARAGVRVDDVILRVDSEPVNDKGRFDALVRSSATGEKLALQIERASRLLETTVTVDSSASTGQALDVGRVEDLKARVVVRDAVIALGTSRRVAAEVVSFLPRSPLPEAGVQPGDVIVKIDEYDVESASHFVYLLQTRYRLGQSVTLVLWRANEQHTISVDLWAPDRVLTKLMVPLLFNYERDVHDDRVTWYLLDIYVMSLFKYERRGREVEYRFLSLIGFSTGSGELVDVKPAGE